MKVLILGSGGREHALAWNIARSKHLTKLFIAPGNAGTGVLGQNVPLSPNDFDAIATFCNTEKIDMVVVGPEAPLALGIYEHLKKKVGDKLIIVGPPAKGAMLESSKDFAKEFMTRHNIPTACYKTFSLDSLTEGFEYLKTQQPPYVLKADGLAAGKGVLICGSYEEAANELKQMIEEKKFGDASSKVVIEEFLEGIEISVFVITDGKNYKILPSAKDYKRIGENDTGLNTGGMGSISPVPFADDTFMKKVEDRIIRPTIEGLKNEKIAYNGFIFFGLMNRKGDPYVIEYNVRMGDPEAESVIPRIKIDLLEAFSTIPSQKLNTIKLETDPRYCAAIMLVSGGYPGSYKIGKVIEGLEDVTGSIIFHAGSKYSEEEQMHKTNGGRVMAISSFGKDLQEALDQSYVNAEKIRFDGKYYRKDLGKDLMNYTDH